MSILRSTKRLGMAAFLLAVFIGGCASADREPITDLPVHSLHLLPAESLDSSARSDFSDNTWHVPAERNWRYIVVHHSATDFGDARTFDRHHRARGWDELGYHFVIGNGNGAPDGAVQVGSRWRKQKHGAHTGGTPGNQYNESGIGVCVVGSFNNTLPSKRQMASLEKLLVFLIRAYGISPDQIIGHRDAPDAHTACPGKRFHQYLRNELTPQIRRQTR